MKIMVIPDVHGRDYWKSFPKDEFDKIVFLGDYVDSFDKSDEEILTNLLNIIKYKKDNMDKVELLLGNHDLQYLFNYMSNGCSGYRDNMYAPLHILFNDNKHLFKPIHQIDDYIFSHAGITSVWLNKLKQELKDTPYNEIENLEELITEMFNKNYITLYDIGRIRGGWCKSGGPFWADMSESKTYMLYNFKQIVGHTPIENIETHNWKQGNSSITFCDTIYLYHELNI
jgi:hypothetical protein